jgi:3-oxoacyl-ACP reductase-like protein
MTAIISASLKHLMNSTYHKHPSALPLTKPSGGFDNRVISEKPFSLPETDSPPKSAEEENFQPTGPAKSGFFAGKVAIITGSESGIGRETARELCEQGAQVVLNGLCPNGWS